MVRVQPGEFFICITFIPGSSSGRTEDSGSSDGGSNPSPGVFLYKCSFTSRLICKDIYHKIEFMQNIFLKTERLTLREITQNDFAELETILKDKDVMHAWEYDFTDNDIQEWIDKNLEHYKKHHLGFFIMSENESNKIIGQAALKQDIIAGDKYYEISYILKKGYWHLGYATEAAKALKEYAFNILQVNEVIFEIRPNNLPSRRVAEKLGAKICGEFIKIVRNKKMPHLIYKLSKSTDI